jgi:hypothetical protein
MSFTLVVAESQLRNHRQTSNEMIREFIFVLLFQFSAALFETCDETFKLEADENITISSGSTLSAKNVSSCRYTLVAPVDYIVEVTCSLEIDQPDPNKCPSKRFFISVDGINDLRSADFFCSFNGDSRVVRRRSIMNRLVMGYATQTDDGNEKFTCVARRIAARCDCGWSRKVHQVHYIFMLRN